MQTERHADRKTPKQHSIWAPVGPNWGPLGMLLGHTQTHFEVELFLLLFEQFFLVIR